MNKGIFAAFGWMLCLVALVQAGDSAAVAKGKVGQADNAPVAKVGKAKGAKPQLTSEQKARLTASEEKMQARSAERDRQRARARAKMKEAVKQSRKSQEDRASPKEKKPKEEK